MAWVCKICSTNNPDSTDVCFVCDAERDKSAPVKESTGTAARRKKSASSSTRASTSSTRGGRTSRTSTASTTASTSTSSMAASTRKRGTGMRSTAESTASRSERRASKRSSARERSDTSTRGYSSYREERARDEAREAKFRENLINARMAIVFTTAFASVICGLAEQLKNWQVFEWIVGIGCGCVLLFWAMCICTNSIGYFKVKPKKWWTLTSLGLGIIVNALLFLTVERFLVVFIWWSLYAAAGGVLTVRWAFKNGYKGILWTAIAETAAAVFLLFFPLIG